MITPALSRKVAHWLLTSDAPTSTRLLIMEATSGPGATDEELLLALEAAGVEGEMFAALAAAGRPE